MRPLTFKSNFAKNPCKNSMAVLVPFLLFGCSGGKTEKSDAGAKSKDVQVQTTGSEEQRKLAMGATAVPGVSVSAVFGADADKLMAFGLKELGKSGDSLSLAGPVYKLSATADRKPGPDGCYAVLPVTTGSICFDERISSPVSLVPTVVPGTAAAPKLGLFGDRQKSSELTKVCTNEQQDSPGVWIVACDKGHSHQSDVAEPNPEAVAVQDSIVKPNLPNPNTGTSIKKQEFVSDGDNLLPKVKENLIVPPKGGTPGSSMTDPSNLSKLDDPSMPKSEISDINPPAERQKDPFEEFPEDKETQPLWGDPNWTTSPTAPPPPTVKKDAPTDGARVEVEDQSEALLDKE